MAATDYKSYILDMDVFHWLVHAGVEPCGLSGRRLFATHSQLAGLRMLKDAQRRSDLLKAFEGVLSPDVLEPHGIAETGALTDSQFLNSSVTSTWITEDFALDQDDPAEEGQPTYSQIFEALNAREHKRNNAQDAVVIETAIKQKATLITGDRLVAAFVRQWGGEVEEWMLPPGLQAGVE